MFILGCMLGMFIPLNRWRTGASVSYHRFFYFFNRTRQVNPLSPDTFLIWADKFLNDCEPILGKQHCNSKRFCRTRSNVLWTWESTKYQNKKNCNLSGRWHTEVLSSVTACFLMNTKLILIIFFLSCFFGQKLSQTFDSSHAGAGKNWLSYRGCDMGV